jgi:hypothetical protein
MRGMNSEEREEETCKKRWRKKQKKSEKRNKLKRNGELKLKGVKVIKENKHKHGKKE